MKDSEIFLEAARLIATGQETYCCHAIVTACPFLNFEARSRRLRGEFEQHFKPWRARFTNSTSWWPGYDRESRVKALCAMAGLCMLREALGEGCDE